MARPRLAWSSSAAIASSDCVDAVAVFVIVVASGGVAVAVLLVRVEPVFVMGLRLCRARCFFEAMAGYNFETFCCGRRIARSSGGFWLVCSMRLPLADCFTP